MTVLAIDDDPTQLELLRSICGTLHYPQIEYLAAETLSQGSFVVENRVIDLVITDLRLPDGSGIDLLHRVKAMNPMLSVVVMTAYDDTREAVAILKAGADDYLIKPTTKEEIERLLIRVNERSILVREAFLPPADNPIASPVAAGIVYKSEAMARVMNLAARCADSHATVLLSGESGTGKELVARFIHERGIRKDKPFIAVNISALPESLAESELFGHRRGAFTGADTDRIGRFEEADGGTLFLDEIGEISPALQVKLLRALQFGVIERVGENLPRRLNVRIIAATNHNLSSLVVQGKFRKDLFYRVNVITIEIPPLRDRKEDVSLLISHFVERFNARDGRQVQGVSREVFDRLIKHSFPGNVRELENIIEHAVVLARGDTVLASDIPAFGEIGIADPGRPQALEGEYEETMLRFERALLSRALERVGGNQSKAARALGISERHLRSRLLRLGMKG